MLERLAAGQSNKEIARTLGLSPNTVKTHIANLFAKLEVGRRTQAISKARDLHLISMNAPRQTDQAWPTTLSGDTGPVSGCAARLPANLKELTAMTRIILTYGLISGLVVILEPPARRPSSPIGTETTAPAASGWATSSCWWGSPRSWWA